MGRPGDRNYWISFQTRKFEQMPEFETVSVGMAYETAPDAPPMPQLRLTEGASAEMINWPNLGYADAYTESFATFERMQNEGTIPSTCASSCSTRRRWLRWREQSPRRTMPKVAPLLRAGAVRRPRYGA